MLSEIDDYCLDATTMRIMDFWAKVAIDRAEGEREVSAKEL